MNANIRQNLIDIFSNHKIYTLEEICNMMNENEEEIVCELTSLCDEYILYKSKKNKYGLLSTFNYYLGNIELNKKGYGFFKCDSFQDDVHIKEDELGNALDKDTVIVWVNPSLNSNNQKLEGSVIKVVKHNVNLICKVIKKNFHFENKMLICDTYPDINIVVDDFKLAVEGDIVSLKILDVDLIKRNIIKGEIVKIIGNINDAGVDIKTICYKYGLEDDFSDFVYKELEDVNKNYIDNTEKETKRRKKVERDIITIDGEDAKDLDDAVHVSILDNGNYLLGVYIADVSYFVKEDGAIDEEALKRGTSVYLINKVVPMLPHKLCNDLCSLNEKEDKYVMALEMEINKQGEVINSNVFEGIINSKHRMTYTNVNIMIEYLKTSDKSSINIENIDVVNKYHDILNMVQNMKDLSNILNRKRTLRGSLNFDILESKIIVDDNDKVIDVVLKERLDAEKLIEEFMLVANETIASMVNSLDLPFIYRVHDEPNSLKLDKFQRVLKNTKYKIQSKGKNITPLALQTLLNEIDKDDFLVSSMLLRMMAKAKYSSFNIGHYGLASKCYTHFTSPIRRYPDLLVHRLLKKYIINSEDFYNNFSDEKIQNLAEKIENIAQISSCAEVNATSCEFEVEDMKKAEYMESKIGEEFIGRICSVHNFGFFVALENTIEGLVHIKTLNDDYYIFNENKMCIIGKRTNKTYKIGDKIKVVCVNANKENKEIDFKVISNKNNLKNKENVIRYKVRKKVGKRYANKR